MKYTKDYIESVEFFDLMQSYRIASMNDQDEVVKRFESVKDVLKDVVKQNTEMYEALKEVFEAFKDAWVCDEQENAINKIYPLLKEIDHEN